MRAPRRRHGRMSPHPTPSNGLSVSTPTSTSPPRRLPTLESVASMPTSPTATNSTNANADNNNGSSVTGVRGEASVTSKPIEEPNQLPSSSLANVGSTKPTPRTNESKRTFRHGTKRPRAGSHMCRRGSSDAGDDASVRAVVACAPVEPVKTMATVPMAARTLAFAAATATAHAHVNAHVGLDEEDDARTLRARVQRLLVQFVMLPVVWVSLCCVITAAIGIEAVESIQKALEQNDDKEEKRRPAKKAKRDVAVGRRSTRRRDIIVPPEEEDCGLAFKHKTRQQIQENVGNEMTTTPTPTKPTTPTRPRRRRVLIWDLDETLVLFASLYSGQFARAHGADLATSVALGEQMMTYLLAVLERHFFFSDLHDADIDHISCVSNVSDGSQRARLLADRYVRIRAIYERQTEDGNAVEFLDDATSQWFTARQALVTSIDMLSTGWLREARELLALTSRNPEHDEITNVMVTNTQLSPALCKCLIYGLDAHFPIESVYSSSKLHKLHCFQTIRAKYGDAEFIGIGDGAEEEQVSHALGMAFFKIRSIDDLRRLRQELQLTEQSPTIGGAQPTTTMRVASPPSAYAAAAAANE